MLAQNAAFQGVALFPGHGADIERMGARGLVRRLLKLAAVDELHISNRRSSRFSSIFVLQSAAKSAWGSETPSACGLGYAISLIHAGSCFAVELGCRSSTRLNRLGRCRAWRIGQL
jgi:hypothetical protein